MLVEFSEKTLQLSNSFTQDYFSSVNYKTVECSGDRSKNPNQEIFNFSCKRSKNSWPKELEVWPEKVNVRFNPKSNHMSVTSSNITIIGKASEDLSKNFKSEIRKSTIMDQDIILVKPKELPKNKELPKTKELTYVTKLPYVTLDENPASSKPDLYAVNCIYAGKSGHITFTATQQNKVAQSAVMLVSDSNEENQPLEKDLSPFLQQRLLQCINEYHRLARLQLQNNSD